MPGLGLRRAWWGAAGGLLVVGMIVAALPARAQTQRQIDWCVNKGGGFPPDLRIDGCKAAIQSGRWSGKDLAWSFSNRGLAFSAKKDYDRAIADYNQAIRLDRNNAFAFNNRGIAYSDNKDYARAIADFDQAISLDPKYANAFNNRCWARAVTGRDLPQALADCNESLRLLPNDANALDSRGLVHLKMESFAKALADYNAALRLRRVAQHQHHRPSGEAPRKAHFLYGRSLAKMRSGDTAGGEADKAAATAIQADIAEVYAGYGVK